MYNDYEPRGKPDDITVIVAQVLKGEYPEDVDLDKKSHNLSYDKKEGNFFSDVFDFF